MPRQRAIPPVPDLLQALREAGVEDAPTEGPAEALPGLLDLALYLAEHRKPIRFPGFTWEDPRFLVEDAKARIEVAYARLTEGSETALADLVRRNLPRARDGRTLLGIDATGTGLREFELVHLLYGEITLFSWPHKPSESADPRIHEARERGWTPTLKTHNLLPGRGVVVLDEHQGMLLREDSLADLLGVLVLYPTGETALHWNPFLRAPHNEPELQHWLAWGPGTGGSSEWREVLRVDRDTSE